MQSLRSGLAIFCLAMLAPAVNGVATAQVDFRWAAASGGDFDNPNNWQSLFPGSLPDVFVRTVFDLPSGYSVAFSKSEHTNAALLRDGQVQFDLGGNVFTHGNLFVGGSPGDVAELLIVDGSVNSGPTALGATDASFGVLKVGENAQLLPNSLRIGDQGSGQLDVHDGGRVTTASANVGVDLTGSGSINVTGMGVESNRSQLTVSGPVTIGSQGAGVMRVGSGGLVESHPDPNSGIGQFDALGVFPAPGATGVWPGRMPATSTLEAGPPRSAARQCWPSTTAQKSTLAARS